MDLRARLSHILLFAPLVAGCTKHFDNAEMAARIQKDVAAQGLNLASVTCPPNQPIREGTKFECAAVDTKGTQGVVDIVVANDHGRFEWTLRNKFMRMSIVGDSLEAKLGKELKEVVDVVCPGENILIKKGVSFSCDVKVGQKTQQITLTAKADDGSDWDQKITPKT